MYLGGFVLHAVAIWLLPLSLAQATVALSLPVTAVASTLLRERLTPVHWWGLVVVTGGLVLLALSSGRPGAVVVTPEFVGSLTAGLVVVALVVVALASRRGHLLRGASLGAIAGVGYAGSAIAVRGIRPDLAPWWPRPRWPSRRTALSRSGSTRAGHGPGRRLGGDCPADRGSDVPAGPGGGRPAG